VICNRDQIIGIGELKYWPRVPSQALDIEKDLTTFELALGAAELELTNDRYLGEAVKGGNRALSLAPNAVFCWAGVYTGQRAALRPGTYSERLLQLDAVTSHGQPR